MHDTAEVFDALKRLQECNVVNLRILLQNEYSTEWSGKEIATKSVERKIKRKLLLFEEMGLVKIERKGKENIYSYVTNYPVKSQASQLMEQLKDLFREDETLFAKAQKPLTELANEIKSPYYIRQNVEDVSSKERVISKLEHAVNEKRLTTVSYKGYDYVVKPLKIAEFEGIWYLLFFYDDDQSYRKYRIAEIENVSISKEHFVSSKEHELEIQNWHNVWHQPNRTPVKVKLWISEVIQKYFYQKNIFDINSFPKRVMPCKDGLEYDVYITHPFELLPELMYWQPNIVILEEEGNLALIETYEEILTTIISRQQR